MNETSVFIWLLLSHFKTLLLLTTEMGNDNFSTAKTVPKV